jgi:hypothetical protein
MNLKVTPRSLPIKVPSIKYSRSRELQLARTHRIAHMDLAAFTTTHSSYARPGCIMLNSRPFQFLQSQAKANAMANSELISLAIESPLHSLVAANIPDLRTKTKPRAANHDAMKYSFRRLETLEAAMASKMLGLP